MISSLDSLDNFFDSYGIIFRFFCILFRELILSRYTLSEFEKFVLLSGQLSNEPLILIRSLQGSQQSYSEAKSLLTKAFSSPLAQKFDILNRL